MMKKELLPCGAAQMGQVPSRDSITDWSDQDVLAAANASMPEASDRRLSELLHDQQAGTLSDAARLKLLELMQDYQEGLLDKARALREAVRRGLHEPLA